ncbi:unnamed protein product [Brugia timori]|uniref:Uncharacterized protein n=1 Tax=Brugia timori TaxID=42155 RepID=A0A3P7Y9H3_9BILA|nr:unnamed protein product [Brugia timori]
MTSPKYFLELEVPVITKKLNFVRKNWMLPELSRRPCCSAIDL